MDNEPLSVYVVQNCDWESRTIVAECCFPTFQAALEFLNLQVERVRGKCEILELPCFKTAEDVPEQWYQRENSENSEEKTAMLLDAKK